MRNNDIIKVVQPSSIMRIDKCEKSDVVSDVFSGTVSVQGEDIPVYFKAYAYKHPYVSEGDRGLINEIIGYLVCHLYGVPQPEQGFVVFMPENKITHLKDSYSPRLKSSYSDNKIIPMFATQRIYAKSLSHTYYHSIDPIKARLRTWRYYKQSLICDEIIANTDRLPQNILTASGKDFWLIDNGKLALEDGTNWRKVGLVNHTNYTNFLADLALNDIKANDKKGISIIAETIKISKKLKEVLPECNYWIETFASQSDKKDWQTFLGFLKYRDDNISRILSHRYGMLQL